MDCCCTDFVLERNLRKDSARVRVNVRVRASSMKYCWTAEDTDLELYVLRWHVLIRWHFRFTLPRTSWVYVCVLVHVISCRFVSFIYCWTESSTFFNILFFSSILDSSSSQVRHYVAQEASEQRPVSCPVHIILMPCTSPFHASLYASILEITWGYLPPTAVLMRR